MGMVEWALLAVALLGLLCGGTLLLLWRRVSDDAVQQRRVNSRATTQLTAASTASHGHETRLTALECAYAEDALRWVVTTPLVAGLQAQLGEHQHPDVHDLRRVVAAVEERCRADHAGYLQLVERLDNVAAAQETARVEAAPREHTHAHSHEITWPEHTHPTNEHWHTEDQGLESVVAAQQTALAALEHRLAAVEGRPYSVTVLQSEALPQLTSVPVEHPLDHPADYYQVGGTWEHGQLHVTQRCRLCGHLVRQVAPPPTLD